MDATFYVSAAVAVLATVLAITRPNAVHALLYLIVSLLAVALVLYTLGAPFVAALEVIIYAGAIMVLFLFIVMMLKVEKSGERLFPLNQWLPTAVFGVAYLAAGFGIIAADPEKGVVLKTARAEPGVLGQYIFEAHWLSLEIVSLLLLVAIIGALLIARQSQNRTAGQSPEGDL
jgi:NADH-quinone oxidoreductase subunit J